MKKFFIFILGATLFFSFLNLGNLAQAQTGGVITISPPIKATSFEVLIEGIIDFIFTISLAFVPLMIVIAGIMFVTAAGNPEQANRAKNIILYTLIGFVIILVSKGLVVFLRQLLGG